MYDFKYIDIDRFRFLTGHGKEFALEVDSELNAADEKSGGQISAYFDGQKSIWGSGCLIVNFLPGVGSCLPATFKEFESDELRGLYEAGKSRYGEKHDGILLMLVLWGHDQKTITTTLPIINVVKQSKRFTKNLKYQVYAHQFTADRDGKEIAPPFSYIGVTGRGWKERWQEHCRAAKNGSHYKFHEAIRTHADCRGMHHIVLGCVETEEEAMSAEEKLVGYESLYPLGLNMIPGGYAGVKYLHKIGAIGRGECVSPDDKQDVINRFFETASRKGLPNPLASANWQNPEYAEKVICSREERLNPGQIRTARFLASIGKTSTEILAEVGARNVTQIDRLLAGLTYSRVA